MNYSGDERLPKWICTYKWKFYNQLRSFNERLRGRNMGPIPKGSCGEDETHQSGQMSQVPALKPQGQSISSQGCQHSTGCQVRERARMHLDWKKQKFSRKANFLVNWKGTGYLQKVDAWENSQWEFQNSSFTDAVLLTEYRNLLTLFRWLSESLFSNFLKGKKKGD